MFYLYTSTAEIHYVALQNIQKHNIYKICTYINGKCIQTFARHTFCDCMLTSWNRDIIAPLFPWSDSIDMCCWYKPTWGFAFRLKCKQKEKYSLLSYLLKTLKTSLSLQLLGLFCGNILSIHVLRSLLPVNLKRAHISCITYSHRAWESNRQSTHRKHFASHDWKAIMGFTSHCHKCSFLKRVKCNFKWVKCNFNDKSKHLKFFERKALLFY